MSAVLALILGSAVHAAASAGPVSVDVVMADHAPFFILETPREIEFLRVSELLDKTKSGAARWRRGNMKTMWVIGYDAQTEVKKRKYLKLDQIAYGQKFEEFSWQEGPSELRRNVEYLVEISMGGKFAKETFTILDDGSVATSVSGRGRARKRAYSISIDQKGRRRLVPVPGN
ncbi:MAG: hypothetical protein HY403_11490 [Elusimicrobia bacterium]|nr:hypothetical protein [Elusimicrobiota bacterium]